MQNRQAIICNVLATVSTAVFVGPQNRTFSQRFLASRYAMRAPVFDLPVPTREHNQDIDVDAV